MGGDGLVFDGVAESYERARPGYPPALVDEALSILGLRAGSRVLEIGCGTGRLTRELDPPLLAARREALPEAAGWVSRDAGTLRQGAEARRGDVSELSSWIVERDLARPEAAVLFEDVRLRTVRVEGTATADEPLAAVRTASHYLELDRERQRQLDGRVAAGGACRFESFAALVTARLAGAGPGSH